jgi:LuxR family transcriptional regulator, maltose regulon positive regulatory protein
MDLLKTKLFAPSLRSPIISRPRLKARLEAGMSGALTLLSAPAGFGKTTLLSDWFYDCLKAESRQPDMDQGRPALKIAWLTLDEDDNDPLRFQVYLAATVNALKPGSGEGTQALLTSPGSTTLKQVVIDLINSLGEEAENETTRTRFALVLDDYHLIRAEQVHQALAYLLDHLPPNTHLTILTRSDPPLPIPRLRARQLLAEIRADDLRFTTEEAAAFLHQVMGLELSSQDIAALETRTEGWIAGLQMAALSMQGRQDLPAFINAFKGSHRYILDYLVEEVFQQQPEEIRHFLLHTCLLDQLCGPLCNQVSGRSDSSAVLERLEAANLFLVTLDDERLWYRYHQLFRDVLVSRLQQSYPDQIPALHQRAAAWYEDNGLLETAIHHALAGADFKRVEWLLSKVGGQLLTTGRWKRVLDWLDALPPDFVRESPQLCLYYAWSLLLTGKWEPVEDYLSLLEEIMESREKVPSSGEPSHGELNPLAGWRGQAATIRAQIASLQGQLPEAIEQSQLALAYLPEEDLLMRGIVAANLGFSYLTMDDYPKARKYLNLGRQASQAAGNQSMALSACNGLSRVDTAQGELQRAAAGYREVLETAGSRLEQAVVGAHYNLSALLYEWNDLPGALEHIECAAGVSVQLNSQRLRQMCDLQKAEILSAMGDWPGAEGLLLEAQKEATPILAEMVAVARARLAARQGNARQLEQLLQDQAGETSPAYTSERRGEQHVRVQACLTLDKLPEAGERLAALLPLAEGSGHHGALLEALCLQALLEWKLGQVVAQQTLMRALKMAAPAGYVRTFLDLGPPMYGLLKETHFWLQRAGMGLPDTRLEGPLNPPLVAYVVSLLDAFEPAKPGPGDLGGALRQSQYALIEALSERELEILRLMAEGLTNQEIGEKLYLALGTVKSHAHHIFSKLEVKNRTQAIARARELDLL